MILHVDADAFFCQVERRRNPQLAGCPALAVQQHQDVIAADAGAKSAGVTKRMPPADARAILRRVGGALVHVHTTSGQRVSYRPYLAASHELHGLLASAELAKDLSGDGFNGVAVEKASIDEAYVQLPTGSDLRVDGARCADVIRDVVKARLGMVVSVGVAHNKLLSKLASAAAKPDGRRVISSREDIADLLASTPAHRLPGCGGAMAQKIRAALGPDARVADLAKLTESALRSELGANPSTARDVRARSRGECDDPVRRGRNLNKSVGVHTSLALTPRRMYGVSPGVSASGGRPGMFEPLGCRETGRLDSLLRAMASDLAGRVMDLAHAEKRWPRTMTVSLILVLGRSENGDGEEVRCSKRGPFPDRGPVGKTSGNGSSSPDADGETETGKAAHATAEALTRGLIANRGDALVAKVSIAAGEFRASAGTGGGGGFASFLSERAAGEGTAREPAPVDDATVDGINAENVDDDEDEDEDEDGEWYPSPPFYFNPTAETSSGGGVDRVEPPADDGVGDGGIRATATEPIRRVGPGADIASPLSPSPSVPPEQLDGSEPIDATNLLRSLAKGTVSGEDARRALRRRHERTGRAVPTSSASTP